MDKSEIDPRIVGQIKKLEEKYEAMGQSLSDYLDGLLYADYLTYWDYIHLDTLLSLQNPKTGFTDEPIFITYHQITELYFKLILNELIQISEESAISESFFISKLKRINRYFQHLEDSFDIMSEGMDKDQFLKFRMSLLPASGFQSGQFRKIEMASTDMVNLVGIQHREELFGDEDLETLLGMVYWKSGATELATGKKTLTLRQFEEKYYSEFLEWIEDFKDRNILRVFQKNFTKASHKEEIINLLKQYDVLANIMWPLAHYKSAVRYLQKDLKDIAATGGTNWQKYLPPRFQKTMFFPELWSKEEHENWGKQWVMKSVFQK